MTSGPTDNALVEADLRPLVPTKVVDPDVSLTFDLVIVSFQSPVVDIFFLPVHKVIFFLLFVFRPLARLNGTLTESLISHLTYPLSKKSLMVLLMQETSM